MSDDTKGAVATTGLLAWIADRPDVTSRLRREPPDRVLVLACGQGADLVALASSFPNITVYGVDSDTDAVQAASAAAAASPARDRVLEDQPGGVEEESGNPDRVPAAVGWVPQDRMADDLPAGAVIIDFSLATALDGLLEQAGLFSSLEEALQDCHLSLATTRRFGKYREDFLHPDQAADYLLPWTEKGRVALVFGREDRGLTNADIRLCHALVNIPTDAFASLNLAQAVMVMCYEVFTASSAEEGAFAPRLATRHELDGMFTQLRDILVRISYINPENPDYWMNRLRHFGTRLQLRAREVSIIRGIIRQVEWFARKNYEDGLEEGRRRRSAGEE